MWVDNTAELSGYATADLQINTDSDWTAAALLLELTQGSIYQDPNGFNFGPITELFDTHPTLEFDTYVQANSNTISTIGASGDVGGDVFQFDTQELDLTWIDTATDDIGTVSLGRFTLSDDAQGTWSLKIINAQGDLFIGNDVSFTNGQLADPPPPPPPPPVGTDGDFTGDGQADILWRNARTGVNSVWEMDGTDFVAKINLKKRRNTDWKIVATADFTGDGKQDILWRNTANGRNTVWEMNGTDFVAGTALKTVKNLNWRVGGVGDFTGDGNVDILWRHGKDGRNTVWEMDGTTLQGGISLTAFTNLKWQAAGVADLTGDGKVDILWRNSKNGRNKVWEMDGTTLQNKVAIKRLRNNDWQVAGLSDYTGDGERDILWRNTASGANKLWQMQDASYLSGISMIGQDDNDQQPASPLLGLWEG